jgi:hypothetical protein
MTFSNVLEGRKRADEADARRSPARRRERARETPEQVGFGTSGREGDPRITIQARRHVMKAAFERSDT